MVTIYTSLAGVDDWVMYSQAADSDDDLYMIALLLRAHVSHYGKTDKLMVVAEDEM